MLLLTYYSVLLLQITSPDTAAVKDLTSNVSKPAAVDSNDAAQNEISLLDNEVTHFSYKFLPVSGSCFSKIV